jgi:hypothetical protein
MPVDSNRRYKRQNPSNRCIRLSVMVLQGPIQGHVQRMTGQRSVRQGRSCQLVPIAGIEAGRK